MSGVLIFGAGYLGHRLERELVDAHLVRTDITDLAAVRQVIKERAPEAVINAAAKTGYPNVDWCEFNQQATYLVNVVGALNVAAAAADAGSYLMHLASGCVYYGRCPFRTDGWHEEDAANPLSFYTRTKYAADLVLSLLPAVSILRIRMPLSGDVNGRNLITKLARYSQVVDAENSVTDVDDFIAVARGILDRRATGVFHVVNPGVMRHSELLAHYQRLVDPSYRCEFVTPEELVGRGLVAKARSNTVLASPRLGELGLTMRPIEVALPSTMEKYARAYAAGDRSPV